MKRKSSIVKFILLLVATAIGLVASFVSFNFYPGGKAYKYDGFVHSINLGLDLKGGVYAVYQADDEDLTDTRMNGTVSQLTNLLTGKGYTEATVVREGSNRIRVEVPDVDEPGEIFQIIGSPAELEFWLSPDGTTDSELIFTGDVVENAQAGVVSGEYVVALDFNSEGASKFATVTSENVGSYIRIYTVQDETKTLISNASINEAITGGSATISGDFDYESAQTLADQIMSGTFAVTLSLIESSVVDPTLGENALMAGFIGGAIAFVLIMIFMCIYYRLMGMVASISMVVYMVLMFFFLATLPWVQLSLPGIAGIILSLGMMIDGNVIIYERIKDEFRNGKSLLAAYNAGFKKAAKAIIDGNITTIIAAVMLLIFGTGTVSGFGLTLLIGLILSMFSSLVLTRGLLKWTMNIWDAKNGDKVDINKIKSLYGVRRKPGFDEANEEQYVPVVKAKKVKAKKNKAVEAFTTGNVEESGDAVEQSENNNNDNDDFIAGFDKFEGEDKQ